eukprot:21373-Amphidinium_carterae.1
MSFRVPLSAFGQSVTVDSACRELRFGEVRVGHCLPPEPGTTGKAPSQVGRSAAERLTKEP